MKMKKKENIYGNYENALNNKDEEVLIKNLGLVQVQSKISKKK